MPPIFDLTGEYSIYRGDDWRISFSFFDETESPASITGASFKMQFRDEVDGALILELSTSGGEVTQSQSNKLDVHMPSNVSRTLPKGIFVYDAQITMGDVTTICLGQAEFIGDVSI